MNISISMIIIVIIYIVTIKSMLNSILYDHQIIITIVCISIIFVIP